MTVDLPGTNLYREIHAQPDVLARRKAGWMLWLPP